MHGFDAHETPYINYEIYGPCNKDSNPKAINANIPKSENVIILENLFLFIYKSLR